MPLATVLIPTYEHSDTLAFAIESILAQSVQDFEILVVGDGAPERTDQIMRQFCDQDARIQYFRNPKGESHGEGHRAAALRLARGEIVCYLGDDDLWLPNHLEIVSRALLNEGFDFVHTIQINIRPNGEFFLIDGDLAHSRTRKRMLGELWNFFGPTCVAHRLSTYFQLPFGWRPKPNGIYSDLHMWRQWLELPACRFSSEPFASSLHFPSYLRQYWPLSQRAQELEHWWRRMQAPEFGFWLNRSVMKNWQARVCSAEDFYQGGNALLRLDDPAGAEGMIRHALELDTDVAVFHTQLINALFKLDRLEAALAIAQNAANRFPDDPDVLTGLGNVLVWAECFDEAAEQFQKAIAINRNVAAWHYGLSHILCKMNHFDSALESARRALELSPDGPGYREHMIELEKIVASQSGNESRKNPE